MILIAVNEFTESLKTMEIINDFFFLKIRSLTKLISIVDFNDYFNN